MVAEQFTGEQLSVFQFYTELDQLEIEVKEKHQDFADFNFLFDKIRKKLKAKTIKGIDEDLTNLEELLEVSDSR